LADRDAILDVARRRRNARGLADAAGHPDGCPPGGWYERRQPHGDGTWLYYRWLSVGDNGPQFRAKVVGKL